MNITKSVATLRVIGDTLLALPLVIALSSSPAFGQVEGTRFTSFAGFRLGVGTLLKVEEKLGAAKLVETGDAGDYEAAICYRASSGLIYFLSGEMGGGEDLLGFGISNEDTTKPCSPFPNELTQPTLEISGLRLGITKAEFEKIVVTKVQWDGNAGRAFFESKRPMTEVEIARQSNDVQLMISTGQMQNYFDVVISIDGTFASGRLTAFRVWKVETL